MKQSTLISLYFLLSEIAIGLVLYSVKFGAFGKLPKEGYITATATILNPAYLNRYLLMRRYVLAEAIDRKKVLEWD